MFSIRQKQKLPSVEICLSEFCFAVEQNLDEKIVLQKFANNYLHYFIIVAEVGQ